MSSSGTIKKYGNPKDILTDEQQDVLRNKGMKIDRLQSDITQSSKPLLQSEGSHTWSKHVTPGTLSIFQDEKSWNGISSIDTKRKSGTKEFKDAEGQSWNTMRDAMLLESEDDSFSEGGSPTTTRLDAKDMEIFGAMPMDEDIVVVKCKNCARPILPSQFKEHSASCLGTLENGVFSDDEDTKKILKKKKRALAIDDEIEFSSPVAKRPPSASIEKNEKKKMKKEKVKKTTKQKAPLDLDKQCGVLQGLNNTPCTRSLTCKSHSMGAKRAVDGRSQPYDVLLAAYQKKSIGRPNGKEQPTKKKDGSVSTPSNVTLISSVSGKSIKDLKKLHSHVGSAYNNPNGTDIRGVKPHGNEDAFIDSDEEVENIMHALQYSKPTPLAQKPFFFVKRKRQCYRLRDILMDAITPKSAALNESSKPTLTHNGLDNRQSYYSQQQQQPSLNFAMSGNNPVIGDVKSIFG